MEELGGCTRCGQLNDNNKSCKFHFKWKCKRCNVFHYEFLCSNKNTETSETKVKSSKETVHTAACATEYVVMQSHTANSNMMLPTLTASVNKNIEGQREAEVLLGSAAQSTFTSEKLVSKVKSKIVNKNVNVKVIGFNGVKKCKTRIVEFEVGIGSRSASLKAVVVPEIGINLNTNRKSEINNAFSCRKISLADKHLNDIQPVEILLGVAYARLEPVQSWRWQCREALSGVLLNGGYFVGRK